MQDAALFYAQKCDENCSDIVKDLPSKFILCTIHRAENTDDLNNLTQIVEAVNHIHNSIPIVLPLHPRTQKFISDYGIQLGIYLLWMSAALTLWTGYAYLRKGIDLID